MSKTILCADDSATMQKVGEITFAATEYQYVGARTVDEALRLARAEKPALILADAVMPGKNGYDLCRGIKSDPELANIPVLILCGNSQPYDGSRGEPAGADGHVTKPWDTQVMLDRVTEVLARVQTAGAAKLGEGVAAGAAAPGGSGAAMAGGSSARPPTPPPMAAAAPVAAAPVAPPFAPALTPTPRAPSSATGPTPVPRPASQPSAPPQMIPAATSVSQPARSATIMGMPAFPLPPATEAAAVSPAPAPMTPPAATPAPIMAPASSAPPVRASGSSNDTSGSLRPPMIKGTPQRKLRLVPISETAAQVASEHGIDPDSPEMQALVKLSREVVERIVWEVVPDLAEAIIKQNLDKLTARVGGR